MGAYSVGGTRHGAKPEATICIIAIKLFSRVLITLEVHMPLFVHSVISLQERHNPAYSLLMTIYTTDRDWCRIWYWLFCITKLRMVGT